MSGVFSTESPSAEPLTSVTDGAETSGSNGEKPTLPRSHSERLLAINKEFMTQEKELREKFHEAIYNTAEKVMKLSQNNQIKALKVSARIELKTAAILHCFPAGPIREGDVGSNAETAVGPPGRSESLSEKTSKS